MCYKQLGAQTLKAIAKIFMIIGKKKMESRDIETCNETMEFSRSYRHFNKNSSHFHLVNFIAKLWKRVDFGVCLVSTLVLFLPILVMK